MSVRDDTADAPRRRGRPPLVENQRERILERAAVLFGTHGFQGVGIAALANDLGMSKAALFHYFPSKNDIPWGDFEAGLERMRAEFGALPDDVPLMEAVRHCLVEFNRVPDYQVPAHRRRMRLIMGVPALQAHSTLRFESWREVVAECVGHRLGQPSTALIPQTIAHAALGVALAAYQHWLDHPGSEIADLLDTAMRELARAHTDQ